MIKALALLLFISIGCSNLCAQDSTLVTIKAGNRIKDVLTPADIFSYPQFTSGKVFFKDGSKAMAKMNYNRLSDQMLFIDPKGDTLELADEKTIAVIAIDKDTFFYDEGYVRIIADYGLVKLAEKQTWVVADVRKVGTHNTAKSSVAITSLGTYSDEGARAKSYDLVINENIIIRRETHYYFGDRYNHFARAGKKRLLLLLPKEELSIETYLKENKVNFDKKEDLVRIVHFLGQH